MALRRTLPNLAVLVVAAALAIPAAAGAQSLVGINSSTSNPRLFFFKDTSPGNYVVVPIVGLSPSDRMIGIARRPKNGQLYLLGINGGFLTVRSVGLNGVVGPSITLAHDLSDMSFPFVNNNFGSIVAFGLGFDPVADRLRIVTNDADNLSVNVDNGLTITDVKLSGPSGNYPTDVAYANSKAYIYDFVGGNLGTLASPANGVTTTVGPTGFPFESGSADDASFDISPTNNTGYLMGELPAGKQFFRVNLSTGAAAPLGAPPAIQDFAAISDAGPAITISKLKVDSKGRKVTTTLTCPGTVASCAFSYSLGSTKAVAAKKKKKKKSILKLGSGHATAAGGQSTKITIKLSSKGRKYLKKKKKLAATLTVATADPAGNTATATKSGTLKKPKKKHKK